MPSPLNDPISEDWFRRLNAPLKRLPHEERAALHSEITQHLDQLAAANRELGSTPEEAWALALTQFGDPAKIGRRLAGEWHKSQRVPSAAWQAIGFGIVFKLVLDQVGLALQENLGDSTHPVTAACFLLGGGASLLTGLAIGLKYPLQALRGSFYSSVFLQLLIICIALSQTLISPTEVIDGHVVGVHVSIGHSWLDLLGNKFPGCAAAYLASVTRRGWYRPSLADFKLSLPQKKARA